MATVFTRVSYQRSVVIGGGTVDLVPRLGPASRLVLSRLRIVNTLNSGVRAYVMLIPVGGSESLTTSLLYGTPIFYGTPWDESSIVIAGNQGLAVGGIGAESSIGLVFTAFGELETTT